MHKLASAPAPAPAPFRRCCAYAPARCRYVVCMYDETLMGTSSRSTWISGRDAWYFLCSYDMINGRYGHFSACPCIRRFLFSSSLFFSFHLFCLYFSSLSFGFFSFILMSSCRYCSGSCLGQARFPPARFPPLLVSARIEMWIFVHLGCAHIELSLFLTVFSFQGCDVMLSSPALYGVGVHARLTLATV